MASPPFVLFVCLHGSAKSVIASKYFRRLAACPAASDGGLGPSLPPELSFEDGEILSCAIGTVLAPIRDVGRASTCSSGGGRRPRHPRGSGGPALRATVTRRRACTASSSTPEAVRPRRPAALSSPVSRSSPRRSRRRASRWCRRARCRSPRSRPSIPGSCASGPSAWR